MLSVYILAGDYAISLAFSVRFNFLNTIGNPAVFKRLEFISWDWQNLPLPRKQPKLPVRQMEGSENIETKLIQLAKWYTQTNYICVQYSAQISVFNISRTHSLSLLSPKILLCPFVLLLTLWKGHSWTTMKTTGYYVHRNQFLWQPYNLMTKITYLCWIHCDIPGSP